MNREEIRGGQRVKVVGPGDWSLPENDIGKVGRVVGFDPAWGTEESPMIMVAFRVHKTDGYWLEELELTP